MLFLKVLLILLCFCSLYILVVLVVRQTKGTDTQTARNIIVKFVKDCLFSPTVQQPAVYYPVFIGLDEFGNPHADIIEKIFDDLHKIFSYFYFYDFADSSNLVRYSFHVSDSIHQMGELDLIRVCEKICETIVHRYIHSNFPYFGHVSNIVAVDIRDSVLIVYIAKNPNGVELNSKRKQYWRNFYNRESIKKNEDITESWNDK